MKKIILAYSGGLDTSAIIPWLKDQYQADVICYCSDLGNSPDETFIGTRAKELGASEFIFEDLQESFAKDFCFKSLQANATYNDDYLLGTALARPLISERLVEVARKYGATAIAHGATGKGNDQVRFEKAISYLAPDLEIIAPWKVWEFKGRTDLLNYLQSKNYPFESKEKSYSVDINLYHCSTEGSELERPVESFDPQKIYQLVKAPGESKETIKFSLGFEEGLPTSLNGTPLSAKDLLTQVNQIGSGAGVGVQDVLEERGNGIKSRGIYETPGGYLIFQALKELKHLNWDRKLQKLGRLVGLELGELIYDGDWHSDAARAAFGFFKQASESLTGEIEFLIQNGQLIVSRRQSELSLYNEETVSFESDEDGLHHHALGYCRTLCVGPKLAGSRRKKLGNV